MYILYFAVLLAVTFNLDYISGRKYFTHNPDKYNNQGHFKTLPAYDKLECAKLCVNNPNCGAVNFHKRSKTCILTHKDEEYQLTEKEGWVFMELKEDNAVCGADSPEKTTTKTTTTAPISDADTGWKVIQRRPGRIFLSGYYVNWGSYKTGFYKTNNQWHRDTQPKVEWRQRNNDWPGWLGNEVIHNLTNDGNYVLRVNLTLSNGTSLYADYQSFSVGSESTNYQLSVGTYSGTAGDGLSYLNGARFYTNDNDTSRGCAEEMKGGWWYAIEQSTECTLSTNLNGNSMTWVTWDTSSVHSIRSTEMKIRKIN